VIAESVTPTWSLVFTIAVTRPAMMKLMPSRQNRLDTTSQRLLQNTRHALRLLSSDNLVLEVMPSAIWPVVAGLCQIDVGLQSPSTKTTTSRQWDTRRLSMVVCQQQLLEKW